MVRPVARPVARPAARPVARLVGPLVVRLVVCLVVLLVAHLVGRLVLLVVVHLEEACRLVHQAKSHSVVPLAPLHLAESHLVERLVAVRPLVDPQLAVLLVSWPFPMAVLSREERVVQELCNWLRQVVAVPVLMQAWCLAQLERQTVRPTNPLVDLQVDLVVEILWASPARKAVVAHQKDRAIRLVVHVASPLHLEEDPSQEAQAKHQVEGQVQQLRCREQGGQALARKGRPSAELLALVAS